MIPNLRVLNSIIARAFATACMLAVGMGLAHAQSIEPRAYSNAPVGVNFLLAGYAYTRNGFPLDTALPLTDPKLSTNSGIFAYARVLDLWGVSGKFDVIVPYTWLSGTATVVGTPIEREINGFADPAFRLTANLYGAPAMSLKEFASYKQDLIIGASLQVTAPLGQYDRDRIVNLGTHRWTFKPEVGISQALGPWTVEGQAAVTFYTDNNEFFDGNNKRSQDPVYSLQGHVIYGFDNGIWTSFDVTYFAGGRTSLNDTLNYDLQQNWRVGGTVAFPIDARDSVKFYASKGVAARTGNSYDLIGIAWQYRWGAGL